MAMMQSSVRMLGKALPKFITPQARAVADYATAAIFFGGAVAFWRKNKRAALASLVCGATQAGIAALTDYPGGVKRAISFPLHSKIGFGLSSLAGAMPEFLGFDDDEERTFFRVQSAVLAGITVLTDFEQHQQQITGERERKAA